jgi:hypothetical protein
MDLEHESATLSEQDGVLKLISKACNKKTN